MTKPVNLRQARKRAARGEDRARADATAAAHGRSKAERKLADAERTRAERAHESHRLDRED